MESRKYALNSDLAWDYYLKFNPEFYPKSLAICSVVEDGIVRAIVTTSVYRVIEEKILNETS